MVRMYLRLCGDPKLGTLPWYLFGSMGEFNAVNPTQSLEHERFAVKVTDHLLAARPNFQAELPLGVIQFQQGYVR